MPVTLTLTLDQATWHTVVHIQSSTSTYTPNFIRIGETLCGRTDIPSVQTYVRTDRWTLRPALLGRLERKTNDLIFWLSLILYILAISSVSGLDFFQAALCGKVTNSLFSETLRFVWSFCTITTILNDNSTLYCRHLVSFFLCLSATCLLVGCNANNIQHLKLYSVMHYTTKFSTNSNSNVTKRKNVLIVCNMMYDIIYQTHWCHVLHKNSYYT